MSSNSSPLGVAGAVHAPAAAAAVITDQLATKYWLEIISYPAGNNNRLWLFAGGTWNFLANSTEAIQLSVQNAFNNGSNMQVYVWATGTAINGLVVRTP